MKRKKPMNRGTKPMKRTGFERKTYGPEPEASLPGMMTLVKEGIDSIERLVASTTPRQVRGTYAPVLTEVVNPRPKFTYYRSTEIQMAVRELPCTAPLLSSPTSLMFYCGSRGTAWAHSNWEVHGKGKNIKASDEFVAAMCSACHHELDQGHRLSEEQRKRFWWIAHCRTVEWLVERRLWPASVPIPNTTDYPF